EAATNIININEFDSGTVKRIIQFIYKRDYKNRSNIDNADASLLSKLDNSGGDNKDTTIRPTTAYITLRHVHINAIADYYNIPQLKELTNIKIQHILGTSWSAGRFPNIIKDVFSLIGDLALYNIITLIAAEYIEELVKLKDFVKLDIISDFTIGIVRTAITASKDIEENFMLKL
ncbi:hypothetical protein V2W45_1239388, partial [Cenococcum geophilum]